MFLKYLEESTRGLFFLGEKWIIDSLALGMLNQLAVQSQHPLSEHQLHSQMLWFYLLLHLGGHQKVQGLGLPPSM